MLIKFKLNLRYTQTACEGFSQCGRLSLTWEIFFLFYYNKAKKEIQQRFISVVGIKLWNDVNMCIKMCNSLFCLLMFVNDKNIGGA